MHQEGEKFKLFSAGGRFTGQIWTHTGGFSWGTERRCSKRTAEQFCNFVLKKKKVPHLCWFLYSLNKSMTQNAKCSFWLFFDFSHLDWTQKWFKESNSQLHPHMCQTKLYHIWWSMKRCLTDAAGSLSKNWFFIKLT